MSSRSEGQGRGAPADVVSPVRREGVGPEAPITTAGGVLVQERGFAGGASLRPGDLTPDRPRVPVGEAVAAAGPGRVATADPVPQRPQAAGQVDAGARQIPAAETARGRDRRPADGAPAGGQVVFSESAGAEARPDGGGRTGEPPRDGGGRGRQGGQESGFGDERRNPAALSMGVPENFGLDKVASAQRDNRTVFNGQSTSVDDASSKKVEVHVFRDETIYDQQNTGEGAKTLSRMVVTSADDQQVIEVESLSVVLPYESSNAKVAGLAQEVKEFGSEKKETAARRTAVATQTAIETLLSSESTSDDERLAIPANFAVNRDEFGARGRTRSVFDGEEVRDDGTTLSLSVKVLANRRLMYGQPGVRTVGKATLRDADGKIIARIEALTFALPHNSDAPQVAELAQHANKRTPDLLEGVVRRTGEATLAALETFLSPQEENAQENIIVTAADLRGQISRAAAFAEGRQVPADVYLATLLRRVDESGTGGRDQIVLSPTELDTLRKLQRPDYLEMYQRFSHTEETNQPLADRILVERALSLMMPVRREELLSGEVGGKTSTAKHHFEELAAGLDEGTIDLKQYAIDHPRCRGVLTLLARLDVPIQPNATIEQLRRLALDTLRNRTDLLNFEQVPVMAYLYGLIDGKVKSTAEVAEEMDYHPSSVRNMERITLGIQERDYHRERRDSSD